MSPLAIVKLTATLLWCHAGVLAVAWFRQVARTDKRFHVGHFVALMGEMVPMAAGAILLIFGGAILGLPSVVVFLAVVLPAGLVLALATEVDRLTEPPDAGVETRRLAATLGLAVLAVAWRGGL